MEKLKVSVVRCYFRHYRDLADSLLTLLQVSVNSGLGSNMNPFEKPPKPARNKALNRPVNPFDSAADEDITIEFQSSVGSTSPASITPQSRFFPIVSNPQNKHRPYAATVQYAQPPSPLPRPPTTATRTQPPPSRRVFGGNILVSGDNSPHAVQYRADILSQRTSPHESRNDTESEPSPSVRSPFRLLMPSRSSYQPANRASPGPPTDSYSEGSSSSSSSEEESDEEESSSERTESTAGPSTRSSGSAGLLNDTGIELQTITPPNTSKTSKKNTTKAAASNAPEQKVKKNKARKPRKGPAVCVDEDNENQLIRFLISEKGGLH